MEHYTDLTVERYLFLKKLSETGEVVSLKKVSQFLESLGLRAGVHYEVLPMDVLNIFGFSPGVRVRLLRPLGMRLVKKRDFNRMRIELSF
jgi:hypothetical protein